jgi:uncharacterized protein with FMN-binding domain
MRRVIMAVVSTVAALILLLSFKTHSTTSLATPPAAVASTVPSAGSTPAPSASAAAPASASAVAPSSATTTTTPATKTPAATKTTAPTTKTVTGDAIDTRYGPVQVKITVTNGKLTAVQAVDYPQQERRDQEINAYAIPALDKEALAAGSAKIDNVSGATYTSDGYANSLQSALDKAGL